MRDVTSVALGNRIVIRGAFTISPPLSAKSVAALRRFREIRSIAEDGTVLDRRRPPPWCPWTPSDDGQSLGWDGLEKPTHLREWLAYLEEEFLYPAGHALSGCVEWEGEGVEDWGFLAVEGREVIATPGKGTAPSKRLDPSLGAPLFAAVTAANLPEKVTAAAFAGGRLVVGCRLYDGAALVSFTTYDSERARLLLETPGAIEHIVSDPNGGRVAILVVARRRLNALFESHSSEDAARVLVVDLASGEVDAELADGPSLRVSQARRLTWSDDGRELAVRVVRDQERCLCVLETLGGATRFEPDPWVPKKLSERSPDALYDVVASPNALHVTKREGGATRTIGFPNADVGYSISAMTSAEFSSGDPRFAWLHPHRFVLHGLHHSYAFDLESGKCAPLFADPKLSFLAASSSEPVVAAIDDQWKLHTATYDPDAKTIAPRLTRIVDAVRAGAKVSFLKVQGRQAVKLAHADGAAQTSFFTDEEIAELRAALEQG